MYPTNGNETLPRKYRFDVALCYYMPGDPSLLQDKQYS